MDSSKRRWVQSASSLPVALFAALHLATHASFLVAGRDANERVMAAARAWYNGSAVVEAGLLASIAVHAGCGVLAAAKRSRREWEALAKAAWNDPEILVHKITGWYLLAAMAAHIPAARVGPKHAGVTPMQYAIFATEFLPEFFVPYYLALVVSGALHLCTGLTKAWRVLKLKPSLDGMSPTTFWGVAGGLAVVSASAALAMMGFFYPVPIPPQDAAKIIASYKAHYPAVVLDFLTKRWELKQHTT